METHPNLDRLIALSGALILSGLSIGWADEAKKAGQNSVGAFGARATT